MFDLFNSLYTIFMTDYVVETLFYKSFVFTNEYVAKYTAYFEYISFKCVVYFYSLFHFNTLKWILVQWFDLTINESTDFTNLLNIDFNSFYQSFILDKATNSACVNFFGYELDPKWAFADLNTAAFMYNLEHPYIQEGFYKDCINYVGSLRIVQSYFEIVAFCEPYIQIIFNLISNLYFFFLIILVLSSLSYKFLNSFFNIDIDNFFSTAIVEAEKEVGAPDDYIFLLIFIFFLFGWYFAFDFFSKFSFSINSKTFVWTVIPIVFILIFSIPTFLLIDFGIYFFIYLRGSGTVSGLAGELMFDCINLFGYYIRVHVQCVRIILMLTTLGSFQETVLNLPYKYYFVLADDGIVHFFNNTYFSDSIMLDFFIKICALFSYFLYEIFHTYFVITIQTIAFFAMVFWLFFYLFTFFVSEQFETYFLKKRKLLYLNRVE